MCTVFSLLTIHRIPRKVKRSGAIVTAGSRCPIQALRFIHRDTYRLTEVQRAVSHGATVSVDYG